MRYSPPLFVCAVYLFVLMAGRSAQAQDVPSVVAGDRVRVHMRLSRPEEGVFATLSHDSLGFSARDGSRRSLALADIQSLEVARGSETRERSFALGGLFGGGVIGAVLGAQAIQRQNSQRNGFPQLGNPTTGGVAGALLGALAGGFIGDLVGRQLTTTRWLQVSGVGSP